MRLVPPKRAGRHAASSSVAQICPISAAPCVLASHSPITPQRRTVILIRVLSDPSFCYEASLFRTLGHPARVRILELLRDGEQTVGALQESLGLTSGGTSQHLAARRRIGVFGSRREGRSIFCRASDLRVFCLLDTSRELIARSLQEQQALLEVLAAERLSFAP